MVFIFYPIYNSDIFSNQFYCLKSKTNSTPAHTENVTIMHTDCFLIDNYSFYCSGQMSGYYNPYAGSFSAAHMAAAAAAAAAQQSGQVSQVIFCLDILCTYFR